MSNPVFVANAAKRTKKPARKREQIAGFVIVVLFALLGGWLLITVAGHNEDQWRAKCNAKGGYAYIDGRTRVCINQQGGLIP